MKRPVCDFSQDETDGFRRRFFHADARPPRQFFQRGGFQFRQDDRNFPHGNSTSFALNLFVNKKEAMRVCCR
jgi:hypothetical protein